MFASLHPSMARVTLRRTVAISSIAFLASCVVGDPSVEDTEDQPVVTTCEGAACLWPSGPPYDATGCLGPGCADGLGDDEFDYVIVGAGAGGGPLAASLAQRGHRVLLLEAGTDPGDRLTYQIPAWHALASEDPSMRWDYFVDHYDDPAQAGRDDKLVRNPDGSAKGIWYPRGSGIGGSTAVGGRDPTCAVKSSPSAQALSNEASVSLQRLGAISI